MLIPTIIGGAAAGAVLFAGYHSIVSTSQLYGATFVHSRDPRQLALTYDDGPNDPYTFHMLDVLAEFDVRATFFMIGKHVAARPDIVARLSAAGHAIGNHTYSHPNLLLCSVARTRQEIADCNKAIADAAPARNDNGTGLFRCPFGARRPATLRTVREANLTPIMWDVTCFDWQRTTAERVAGFAQRGIKGGNVILLHDGGQERMGVDRSPSVQATRLILARYVKEGFRFVTIPEMMAASA